MVYTKFVSLIASDPIVQTMLPLTPAGEICDVDGNCVDPDEDELFKLTTKSGELTLEREKVSVLDSKRTGSRHLSTRSITPRKSSCPSSPPRAARS